MKRKYSKRILAISLTFSLAACGNNFENTLLADDPTEETVVSGLTDDSGSINDELMEPQLTMSEKAGILARYDHLDPTRIVPTKDLEAALLYFEKNRSRIKNKNYISVIKFGKSSKQKRFYIVNMKTGAVWPVHVAHGKGSDANHDGFAERFSNKSGSNASSLGYYLTAETYYGQHGLSLRLDGLSSTNSNARARAVVIHGASYVRNANVIQGRSWGCPAVTLANRDKVIQYLKGGSLIYAVK